MSDTMALVRPEPAIALDARVGPLGTRMSARSSSTCGVEDLAPDRHPARVPADGGRGAADRGRHRCAARSQHRAARRAVGGVSTKPAGDAGATAGAHGPAEAERGRDGGGDERQDRHPQLPERQQALLHALDDVVQERAAQPPREQARPSAHRRDHERAPRTRSVRRSSRWPHREQVIDRPPRRDLDSASRASAVLPPWPTGSAHADATGSRCWWSCLPRAAGLALDVETARLVDLTHPFDDTTIYWPTARRFHSSRSRTARRPGGWWYAANDFCAAEHGGTHLDAPIHFAEGGWTADEIPLDRLRGPGGRDRRDVARRSADRDLLIRVRRSAGATRRPTGASPTAPSCSCAPGWATLLARPRELSRDGRAAATSRISISPACRRTRRAGW